MNDLFNKVSVLSNKVSERCDTSHNLDCQDNDDLEDEKLSNFMRQLPKKKSSSITLTSDNINQTNQDDKTNKSFKNISTNGSLYQIENEGHQGEQEEEFFESNNNNKICNTQKIRKDIIIDNISTDFILLEVNFILNKCQKASIEN
jgi:hypothetical protein